MIKSITIKFSGICLFLFAAASAQTKENIIQIDLAKILNARSVTTISDRKLTTWSKGIDGNGESDGYLTMSASIFNGDKNPKALPDNPLIPANNQHPEVLLHYSNNDSISNQTVAVSKVDSFNFVVPSKYYSALFLAFTSAEGASKIKVVFHYSDGVEFKTFEVPDYYQDITEGNSDFCYLLHDLAKWGKKNNMTEPDHHNIDLLNIHPDFKRLLTGIQIIKSENGYLVFWSATGVFK